MHTILSQVPPLDADAQAGLLIVAFLLLALLAIRIVSRPKPALRLLVQGRASRGLTVPAIARELSLSQDAVRLLLTTPAANRKNEPSGRNYREDRQVVPQASRRVQLGKRCDVSA